MFSLCSCGDKSDEIIGKWRGAYFYKGDAYSKQIEFKTDGSYIEITFKNAAYHEMKTGQYGWKDGKLCMIREGTLDGDGIKTPLEYDGEVLKNSGYTLYIVQ